MWFEFDTVWFDATDRASDSRSEKSARTIHFTKRLIEVGEVLTDTMMHRRTFLVTTILSTRAVLATDPVEFESEESVRFRTADVVPADIIKGPNYELDPVTTLSGGRMVFRIHTRWGTLLATGRAMLELRVSEMYAIERAIRMNRDPQLIGSFLGTVDDTRRGTRVILTDPIGSVLRVPQAVGAGLNDFVNVQNRRSGGEVRRRVAAQLDCDPETSNPVLASLLDWIAARQGVGSLAGKVGMSLVLPGLGLIPASAQFKEQLASKQPSEINAEIEQDLVNAGFAVSLSRTFCRDTQYTTLQRLQIHSQLQPLAVLPERDALLHRVVSVKTVPDSVSVLRELVLLNNLQESDAIVSINAGRYLTVVQQSHACHIVCADDYLVLSESLYAFARSYASAYQAPPADLQGQVKLSERARMALMEAGIQSRSVTAIR